MRRAAVHFERLACLRRADAFIDPSDIRQGERPDAFYSIDDGNSRLTSPKSNGVSRRGFLRNVGAAAVLTEGLVGLATAKCKCRPSRRP
ncbi:MAG: hypothetical protein QM702_03350 [Rubrivivax sp.]